MFLSTANSSFIFERLRRSMMLWAVLRAILRPAALVDDGCLRFEVELEAGPDLEVFGGLAEVEGCAGTLGVI